LHRRARLASGKDLTAVELQLLILEEARRFVAGGGCEGVVPDAPRILELWSETLGELRARDYPALARRLDWVLKLQMLQRVREQRPALNWASAELKHLDFMYASLEDGLYWTFEKGGQVDTLVPDGEIEHLRDEPPENTRAWTRAMLLRLAEPQQVERVDWDSMTFSLKDGSSYWQRERKVCLTDPLGFTRRACERVFQPPTTLEEALEILGAPPPDAPAVSSQTDTTNHQQK
jgi:proteasome accessory factor A